MNIFICPTNLDFMPYADLYPFDESSSTFILWDRFGTFDRKDSCIVYRDRKVGHKRNVIDYLLYSFFVYKWIFLNLKTDDKIVLFGPQLTFFIWPLLLLKRISYVIDYRDYHALTRFTPDVVYRKATFVAVSSPAYSELFPSGAKVLVSHNYKPLSGDFYYKHNGFPYVISCIGAIRDFEANSELIYSLKNDNRFLVKFHGTGISESDLKCFTNDRGISNVEFTGHYKKADEMEFYRTASFINLLRKSDSYNDRVALPNRLYNSAMYRVPILCYRGTLLAEYVEKYNLGVCISSKEYLKEELLAYIAHFDQVAFINGVDMFLSNVDADQKSFIKLSTIFLEYEKDVI